jgi:murein DD-endopeptidase MepM/ murein hydrolase activator NlpD
MKIRLRNLQGYALLGAIFAILVLFMVANAQPAPHYQAPVEYREPTLTPLPWQIALDNGGSPRPTDLPTYQPPTLALLEQELSPAAPGDLVQLWEPTATPTIASLVQIQATATRPTGENPGGIDVGSSQPVALIPTQAVKWQPPALLGPISLDPRDHYWMVRPVAPNANSEGAFNYPYGSTFNGIMKLHHGLDMSNDKGTPVRASGDGVVIWASDGLTVYDDNGRIIESIAGYGKTVCIEHDFGHKGRPIWTIYAHLSAITVKRGERVSTGDVVGLVGTTGSSTGDHLHFEVRVGENRHRSVRNPDLWIVPFEGSGVIAGDVRWANGARVTGHDVSVLNVETGRVYAVTKTYASTDLPSDEGWDENFTVPNVPAGEYDVVVRLNGRRIAERITVVPGATAFVEISDRPHYATPQPVP